MPRLKRYVEDGRLCIENDNLVENSIRPVALDRKYYLFAVLYSAAQNIAMLYSLPDTCKMNDIEPFQWMRETPFRSSRIILRTNWKNFCRGKNSKMAV